MRASVVGIVLGGLVAAPFVAAIWAGFSVEEMLLGSFAGLFAAVDAVGWVLVPQLVLAVGILSLALQQLVAPAGGLPVLVPPAWLDPAVESALLLGLLGTISGMVSGFVGVAPDELQPGPLVYSLGQALRSSFVGFLIALVGVWAKARSGAAAGPLAA